jgi:hypothetical protein
MNLIARITRTVKTLIDLFFQVFQITVFSSNWYNSGFYWKYLVIK